MRSPEALEHNFPMALDEADHRLFVGSTNQHDWPFSIHSLARCSRPSNQDADDLYYDAARKRIYVAGGEGLIYVFQQKDPDHYQLLVKISSALGARTAGYFGKGKRVSTVFGSQCPLVPSTVPKFGSTPCKTKERITMQEMAGGNCAFL
jgi:hypothetical protein